MYSVDDGRPFGSARRRLAIGCFGAICRSRVGDQLIAFSRAWPMLDIGVHEMRRAELLPALQSGSLDLVIMPDEQPSATDIRATLLWRDTIVVAIPRDHILVGRKSVTPDMLRDELFLVSSHQHRGDLHRFLAQRIWPHGRLPSAKMVELGARQLLQAVAGGEGLLLACASDLGAEHASLVRPIITAQAGFVVSAYWHAEQWDSALSAVLDMARIEE